MENSPAETTVAPIKAQHVVEDTYLDLETKEIVKVWDNTTSRYRVGDTEFSVLVDSKAYQTVNARKSS
jgi:hypothetical protein